MKTAFVLKHEALAVYESLPGRCAVEVLPSLLQTINTASGMMTFAIGFRCSLRLCAGIYELCDLCEEVAWSEKTHLSLRCIVCFTILGSSTKQQ